ncbi:sensor histidine kinase [Clostridium sp. C105KSO13]|uniref:sensor histidine kinase n=1 Tax=Clostridium sp. C105KSO13 TaxID=1776045 RepID=UPI00074068D9|nr:histidine kinase [Clostridium sp. C105KSO13]CUX17374.1 putative sensor-like histidine kinase [Clostridium sp. C105KSO13]
MKLKKSLRTTFLGCLLGVSILPVIIIFISTIRNNSSFYQSQISELGNHEVQSKVTEINNISGHLQEVLTALIFSTYDNESCMLDICSQEAMGERPSDYERLLNARKFEYVSSNLTGTDEYVEGVYLFNENGHVYSYVKNKELTLEDNYTNAQWYQTILQSSDFEATQIYKNKVFTEGTIIMGRMFSGEKGKSILLVVCNENILRKMFKNDSLSIVDGDGNTIYGWKEETLSSKIREAIKKGKEGILPSNYKNETYAYGTLNVNNWKIVSKISFEELRDLYFKNLLYLIGIIGIVGILVVLLVIYADRRFLKPLILLTNIMRNSADVDTKLPEKERIRQDEIGFLYRGYEKMICEIRDLIQEKYVYEIRFLNSKLQSLMSQINAHFIFNTLENISSLAFLENNKQIATMSKALGDMLRYSIEHERDEETLETEIAHIQQYIKIQEIRFGNHILLKQNLEKGTENAKVPKFMLQPIIENAIEHGLAEVDMPWILWIDSRVVQDKLIVTVQDNGAGMSDEAVKKVNTRIHNNEEESSDSRYVSIGLSNIYKRIQLLYSKEDNLNLECQGENGVRIVIQIPFHK